MKGSAVQDTPWQQINITYPGDTRCQREHHAVAHLTRVLPAAEANGLITSWWIIRKGAWRIRFLPSERPHSSDLARELLTDGVSWTGDIYEPETDAFGGAEAMITAHTLFAHDSRHLLTYLSLQPADRRERSVLLCTALMRAAALDLNEQGDVWARVVQHRIQDLHQPPTPDTHQWQRFTGDVRRLVLGSPRNPGAWHTGFENTGTNLRLLRDAGHLTRGLRAVIALHIIFHWNRLGLSAATQARLAQAARDAIFADLPIAPAATRPLAALRQDVTAIRNAV